MMTPAGFQSIDGRVADEIRRLHKQYPKLGHHGLAKALHEAGFDVEADELKRFMKEEGLKPQRDWRPWRWRGLPAWMGGRAEPPKIK